MEENHSGSGYFQRAGVRDWQDYGEKSRTIGKELKGAIDATQPFVQEDLSFLWALAKDGNHVADSNTLAEVWQPPEKGGYNKITQAQQEILRGKISKVLEK